MTQEEWNRINELFDRFVELEPVERERSLRKACQGDVALFDTVYAMFNAHSAPPSIIEHPLEQLVTLVDEPVPDQESEYVNAYRLIRRVGEGGMGVVYEAERDDGQFNKRVAVKRIKRGMDSDEIVRRFNNERQILASLEHPNIARLLDGGMSEGRPYFVMEYVEGQDITTFADECCLDIDQRLQLFGSVCSAVQHAHQNLVIHRDLKPSNIRVTPTGEVKLLDFGIAQVLSGDSNSPASNVTTRTGHRVMTPAYASPEQIRGLRLSTASDVYSLGIVLFELLTGRRPFSTRSSESPETEVMKPSTALTRLTPEDTERITKTRSTTTAQLNRRLRGDLDTIILKSLHPAPERRYQSADQFLDDIKRHLANLPVKARPDSFGYRTRKYIIRHRLGVSTAAAVVGLLVAFALAMAHQQAQTALERDSAEEVAAFLENMFAASDPFADERLDTLRVRALLQRGTTQIQEGLSDQPLVQARMLHIIGRVNGRLGLHDEALPLLQQALSIRRNLPGKNQALIAESLIELGDIQYAQGSYAAADSSYLEALSIRSTLYGPDHLLVAEAVSKRGLMLSSAGDRQAADSLFQKALSIQQNKNRDRSSAATTMSHLASLYDDEGKYAASESLHVASLHTRRSYYASNHPAISTGLRNLSIFLRNRNRYEEAEPFIREAIAIDRETLDDKHPHLITDLNTLAGILRRKEDYAGADSIFTEVLALRRERLGHEHPDVSITLDSYARVLKAKGDFERAESMQREAIAIARNVYGDEHMSIAITTGNLASILSASGDPVGALPVYQEALQLYEKLFSEEHPTVAVLRSNTAGCLIELTRFSEAQRLLQKSYAVLSESHGTQHRLTQSTIRYLITLYEAWDKPAEKAHYETMLVH